MFDGAVTRAHRPVPNPKLDINPASDVEEYTMDVRAYLAEKYPNLPKPERQVGTAIRITKEQRENAQRNRADK